jgi:hypothetical protein
VFNEESFRLRVWRCVIAWSRDVLAAAADLEASALAVAEAFVPLWIRAVTLRCVLSIWYCADLRLLRESSVGSRRSG